MVQPLVLAIDLPAGLDPAAIDAACGAVRAYCEWHIAPSVLETVTVDGSGGPVQFLPTLHLTNVQDVTSDGTTVDSPEWSQAGMLRRSGGALWSSKWRGVTATIEHGYITCPEELVGVVASLASSGMVGRPAQAQAGPYRLLATEAQQAGASALSPAQQAVLDRYRIPSRP